jgi:DNA-binding FadR family transcriptional regulator
VNLVRREPLADQAAELLWARIRAGEWPLGAKLPGETTLAPQLGVGRSTVREAIRQLAGKGVLASRQGAGVFVTALEAPEDWAQTVRRAEIRSVLEARIAIEVEATGLATARRTATDLRALKRALENRRVQRDTIETLVDADLAFHRAVVVASHNPLLLELFDSFTPRSRQAMVEMLHAVGGHGDDADHELHQQVLDAIVAREEERAVTLTRSHLLELAAGV